MRRGGVAILRVPPSRSVYKAGETVTVIAIAALISREGLEHAIKVLRILGEANIAPIKADHLKAVDRLLTQAEFGALDVDTLLASILGYPRRDERCVRVRRDA